MSRTACPWSVWNRPAIELVALATRSAWRSVMLLASPGCRDGGWGVGGCPCINLIPHIYEYSIQIGKLVNWRTADDSERYNVFVQPWMHEIIETQRSLPGVSLSRSD